MRKERKMKDMKAKSNPIGITNVHVCNQFVSFTSVKYSTRNSKLNTITWYPEKETAQGEEESYIASI